MTTPSWDLFIGLFFIIGVSYGFILQREKVTGTLVSTYVGMVITALAAPYVQQFFAGETTVGSIFIKASPTPFMIKSAIFALVVILLTTKAGLAGMRSHSLLSPVEVLVYSAMTIAIIIAVIIGFLDDVVRAELIKNSSLAAKIIQYNDLIMLSPVVVLIALGFRRHGRHGELQD